MTDRPAPTDLILARQDLRADCARCQALCCVAPAFAKSAEFAFDKPAGRPCLHLGDDLRCTVHATLRRDGFAGCAVFDCFGAGQQIVEVTYAGSDWRQAPQAATSMFAVFSVMRQLKQLMWYLAEAAATLPPGALREEVERVQEQTRGLVNAPAHDLEQVDPAAHRAAVGPLLSRVSETLRAGVPGRGPDRVGADLTGAHLTGADLRGISLRGAYLLGAHLQGADLSSTDLLGADLRGADLAAARLADSLFLTQPQLDSARGDTATTLPPWSTRPAHWPGADPGSRTDPELWSRSC